MLRIFDTELKTQDRRQRTEDRRQQKQDDRAQMTEDRWQRTDAFTSRLRRAREDSRKGTIELEASFLALDSKWSILKEPAWSRERRARSKILKPYETFKALKSFKSCTKEEHSIQNTEL
jgi:hypothetical protein